MLTSVAYAKTGLRVPGDYLVRVERANKLGHNAVAHLAVHVDAAN